jgi:hypothetical protein
VTVKTGTVAASLGVLSPLAWATTHRLTLDSFQSIHIRAPIVVQGTAGLTLTTNDGGSGGDYDFNPATSGSVTFWDTASSLVINGQSYTLVNDLNTLNKDVFRDPNGYYALAGSYDASVDGVYSHAPVAVDLDGTFEGLGNQVSNLTVFDPAAARGVGLFSSVGTGGVLRDIHLSNLKLNAGNKVFVGGLVGAAGDATILDATVSGSVIAGSDTMTGGLVGYASGVRAFADLPFVLNCVCSCRREFACRRAHWQPYRGCDRIVVKRACVDCKLARTGAAGVGWWSRRPCIWRSQHVNCLRLLCDWPEFGQGAHKRWGARWCDV